jgi:hypothetical protein
MFKLFEVERRLELERATGFKAGQENGRSGSTLAWAFCILAVNSGTGLRVRTIHEDWNHRGRERVAMRMAY